MIKFRTLWRLIRISAWTPPPGVHHSVVVDLADGTLDVLLELDIYQSNLTLMPGARFDLREVFGILTGLADHLCNVAATTAGQLEAMDERKRDSSTPEDRVAQALDLYGLAFEAKLASSANSSRKGSR